MLTRTDHLSRAVRCLEVLAHARRRPWAAVVEAAVEGPARIHRALHTGPRPSVPCLDLAIVCGAVVEGERVSRVQRPAAGPGLADRLQLLVTECLHGIHLCGRATPALGLRQPAMDVRARRIALADGCATAYRALSPGWRAGVLHSLITTTELMGRQSDPAVPVVVRRRPEKRPALYGALQRAGELAAEGCEPGSQPRTSGRSADPYWTDERARIATELAALVDELPAQWQGYVMLRLADGMAPMDAVAVACDAHVAHPDPRACRPGGSA